MNIKTYNVYRVGHQRKGLFNIMVTDIDGEWITGFVVEGKSILRHNEKEEGEKITINESLCKFYPVVEA